MDLFCGAGGAAMGYRQAGFDEIVGIDLRPQPRYPFTFVQADALAPPVDLSSFDAIHASPPCQGYSNLRKGDHPLLIDPTRELLRSTGKPYIIENIADARLAMQNPIRLCGTSFNLNVRRHRLFEGHVPSLVPPCAHGRRTIRAYYGKKGWLVWTPKAANVQKQGRKPLLRGTVDQAVADMGIDWMTWDELREAIPPAYTRFIGEQLIEAIRRAA